MRGLALLRARRELWPLAAVPVTLMFVAIAGALAVVYWNAGSLDGWIRTVLPRLEAGAPYTWLWIGPGKALLWLARWVLFAAATGLAIAIAALSATLVSSPVLDRLSQRVERCVAGTAVGDEERASVASALRDAGGAVVNELRRLAFFGASWAVLWLLGLAIPGAAVFVPIALTAVTVFFLPLEYAGYALDRRRVGFRERRAWLGRNRTGMLGFGAAAFLVGIVPGLNLLLLPVLVSAGTLLVLERPPDSSGGSPLASAAGSDARGGEGGISPDRGGDAGSSTST